jgi:hypothetical protein
MKRHHMLRRRHMNFQVRHRRPPVDHQSLYGAFAEDIREGGRFFREARDRVAYVYVTGVPPSHLRAKQESFVGQVTTVCHGHSRMDGKRAHLKVADEVVRHLQLEAHALVRMAHAKIGDGYLIELRPRHTLRRNFWRLYMYKLTLDGIAYDKIEIHNNGSVKSGWD